MQRNSSEAKLISNLLEHHIRKKHVKDDTARAASLSSVKKCMRQSEAYQKRMFMLCMEKLHVNNCYTRYLVLDIVDALFMRSKFFRSLMQSRMQVLMDLCIGDSIRNQLPYPKSAGVVLQKAALRMIESWNDKFGHSVAYKRVRLAYEYLKYTRKMQFPDIAQQQRQQAERQRRALGRQQRLLHAQYSHICKHYDRRMEDMKRICKKVESCFSLLLPSTQDGQLDWEHMIVPEASAAAHKRKREHDQADDSTAKRTKVDTVDTEEQAKFDSQIDAMDARFGAQIDAAASALMQALCAVGDFHTNGDDDEHAGPRDGQEEEEEEEEEDLADLDLPNDSDAEDDVGDDCKQGSSVTKLMAAASSSSSASSAYATGTALLPWDSRPGQLQIGSSSEPRTSPSLFSSSSSASSSTTPFGTFNERTGQAPDVDVFVRDHGLGARTYRIQVDVDSRLASLRTDDNAPIFDALHECAVRIRNTFLPLITKWIAIISRVRFDAPAWFAKEHIYDENPPASEIQQRRLQRQEASRLRHIRELNQQNATLADLAAQCNDIAARSVS
jgi:UVSSA N-terminal domain